MKTFIDAHQLDEILDGFVQEGWLVTDSDGDSTTLVLTNAGKAKREVIFKLQSEVRKRALQGITDQEYTTVIDVLQLMQRCWFGHPRQPVADLLGTGAWVFFRRITQEIKIGDIIGLRMASG